MRIQDVTPRHLQASHLCLTKEFVVLIYCMLCGFSLMHNLTSFLRLCFKSSRCLEIFTFLTIVISFWFNEWLVT